MHIGEACRRSPICGSARSSRRRNRAAPTPFIPAMAFSRRTRISRKPAATPGWSSLDRRPMRSRRSATRPAPRRSCGTRACPACPAMRARIKSDAAMRRRPNKIGFPVMIKAVAGGGGRGMRLVADAASFADALRSAHSEAQGGVRRLRRDPGAGDRRSPPHRNPGVRRRLRRRRSISASAIARCSAGTRS